MKKEKKLVTINYKKLVPIIVGIVIGIVFGISLLTAAVEDFGTYKQDTNITLTQTCGTCTYVNISSVRLGNGTLVNFDATMTKVGTSYYYDLGSDYTSSLGEYLVQGVGDVGGTNTVFTYRFTVNYFGYELTISQSIIYFLLLVTIIAIFIGAMFGIRALPNSNMKDEQGRIMQVSYLKYFRSGLWFIEYMLFVAILYVSSSLAYAYLNDQIFATLLFTLYRITFMMAPIILIVWVVYFFVRFFHDKELQKMLNRGMFPQGRI